MKRKFKLKRNRRVRIAKLDVNKAYIIQVRVEENLPKEQLHKIIENLYNRFDSVGLKSYTIIPVYKDNTGKLTFFEVVKE